jgi:hypothetical protein
MFKKIVLFVYAIILFTAQTSVHSEGSTASTASIDLSSKGMGKIISGSSDLSAAGAELSVGSLKMVGNVAYITLVASGNSLTTTIAVSSDLTGHSLVAVGQSIHVSTTAAGQLLSTAGKIIAFIPNELGRSLIYNQVI